MFGNHTPRWSRGPRSLSAACPARFGQRGRRGQESDVHEGRRADSSRPSARTATSRARSRPMSLRTFEEARPWARSIKQRVATRQMPPVAHQQGRRRPEVQERHVAQRRADRDDRRLGRSGRAAGQSCRHAAAQAGRRRRSSGRASATATAPPDLIVKSPEYTMPAVEPGSVVAADGRHRPASPSRAGCGWSKSGPPTSRAARSCTTPSRTSCRIRTTRTPTRSTAAPPAAAAIAREPTTPPPPINARPSLDGMGHRQGLRPLHGRHGQVDQARTEDLAGTSTCTPWAKRSPPVPTSASGSTRKGEEPKHRSYLIGFTGLKERLGRPRHPAELDHAHGRLHGAEGEHPHHQLPAAFPSARQGDAGRGDSAGRHDPGHQLRRQLQLQLDDQLHLRRGRDPGVPEGHRSSTSSRSTTTRRTTRTTPIRTSGSATAIAPWTKWPTPG